jgi:hypothetical protein
MRLRVIFPLVLLVLGTGLFVYGGVGFLAFELGTSRPMDANLDNEKIETTSGAVLVVGGYLLKKASKKD